jgi:hypothetical protein
VRAATCVGRHAIMQQAEPVDRRMPKEGRDGQISAVRNAGRGGLNATAHAWDVVLSVAVGVARAGMWRCVSSVGSPLEALHALRVRCSHANLVEQLSTCRVAHAHFMDIEQEGRVPLVASRSMG